MKHTVFALFVALLFAACQTPYGLIVVTDIESGKTYEVPPSDPQWEDLAGVAPGDTTQMIGPGMKLITVKIEKL